MKTSAEDLNMQNFATIMTELANELFNSGREVFAL